MSLPLHPIPGLCPLWHSHVKFSVNNQEPTPASNRWGVSFVTFLCQIFSETITSLLLNPISKLRLSWHSHVKFSVKQSWAYSHIHHWAVSFATFPCQIFSERIMSLPLHPIPGLCPLWHSHVNFSVKQSRAYSLIQLTLVTQGQTPLSSPNIPKSNLWAVSFVTFPCKIFSETITSLISDLKIVWLAHELGMNRLQVLRLMEASRAYLPALIYF